MSRGLIVSSLAWVASVLYALCGIYISSGTMFGVGVVGMVLCYIAWRNLLDKL